MKKAFSRPGQIMEFGKKGQNHGKFMEFQNINMEKSWNKNFALCAFHLTLTHCFRNYNCHYLYDDLDSPKEDAVRPNSKRNTKVISVLKLVVVGHQSWKNNKRVIESVGNPV